MTTEQIQANQLDNSNNHHPFYEDERIELPPESLVYRRGKCMVLENGASLPPYVCLKSGLTAKRGVKVHLRSPFRPLTWLKGCCRITVGLSARHFENHRIRCALAWSLIGLGAVMIGLGLAPASSSAVAGILFGIAGGVVRAAFPVWASFEKPNRVVLHGCGESFLALFPAVDEKG